MSSANVFSAEYQSIGYVNYNTASLPFPLNTHFEKCLENGNKKVEKPATFESRSASHLASQLLDLLDFNQSIFGQF
jgi:hypothetical protein